MNQITKKNSLWNQFNVDLTLFLIISALLLYGIFVMWSASGKNYEIMQQKLFQIIGGILIMLVVAQIPPRIYESWAAYIYFLCLSLLITVNYFGKICKGSQRWLDIGIIQFQPSEIMKIAVLLVVAYYLNQGQYPPSKKKVIVSFLFIIIPTILILLQPDLGTAILTVSSGVFVLFLSGISWKMIIFIFLLFLTFSPIFWYFFMHEYQRARIAILLHPENDPLGAGYHIMQSKIAIGSGGITGKGWLQGTQSQLEFLPERHTDFIFAVIGEELGFFGISILLILYVILIFRGFYISVQITNMFGRLITGSFMLVIFTNIIINISMVSGILPIVGIPLPLISYGGSSLSGLMIGFGIIMSIQGNRKMISKIL